MRRGWEAHERYVAEVLDLSGTLSSGSKFFDPGDAVTRGRKSAFPLYADAKYTERASYSIKLRDLRDYAAIAAELGKRLVLPLRFWLKSDPWPEDYVVLSLHDLKELLVMATGQEPAPTRPLLDPEELELLETATVDATSIFHQRWEYLIDKLKHTEVP